MTSEINSLPIPLHSNSLPKKSSTEEENILSSLWRLFVMIFALWGLLFRFVQNLFWTQKKTELQQQQEAMEKADSYGGWETAAKNVDRLEGRDVWKNTNEAAYLYDHKIIEHRLQSLRLTAKTGDVYLLMHTLRSGLVRNIGGLGNSKLFDYCIVGTKRLIEEYTEEVVNQLNFICDNEFEGFTINKKFDFFYEVRQTFGRSALLLSGGATLGMYHLGVIKGLYEQNLLPRVISGSSVGSIIASLACVMTDEELPKIFQPDTWNLNAFSGLKYGSLRRKLFRLIKKGYLMDMKVFESCVRQNIGDVTFKEAYDRTKRILNITVASTDKYEFPRLLNYITAPNVLIWSAACASCALPFLFKPVELMAKDKNGKIVPYHPSGQKWTDGSVAADLPMARLSELFNVNHFIVSQVNPHVAPFLYRYEGRNHGLMSTLFYLLKSELKHRVTQLSELGLIPQFLQSFQPIITQKYHGDITIVPEISWNHFLHLISNPSVSMILECIAKGRRSTWSKISVIKYHCMIEFALEKCFQKLTRQMYQEELNKRGDNSLRFRSESMEFRRLNHAHA